MTGRDDADREPPGPPATQSRTPPRSAASRDGPAPHDRQIPRTDPARRPDRATGSQAEPRATTPPPIAARLPHAAEPAIAPPPAGAAGLATSAPRAATGIVRPDPLVPRITGGATRARATASRGGSRSYGAPIVSGHAIAGTAAPGNATAPAYADDPQAGSAPVPAGVESRDLEALATPEPGYPAQALRDHLEGWVEVEFTVDERGATGDILVAAAEPAGVFDAAATAAVAGWRYLPRVVNGRAVPQRTSVTLRFSVER
jgi:protein TonB